MTMDLFSLGAAAPRTTRGVPYPQETVTPNSQQVRAETAAADAVIPTDGLDVAMATVTSGAGVPIVFCREVSGVGGCWVSPSCVQYGLNVDASDNVEIGYTVVVGQGEYPAIPEADVYYGSTLFNTLTDYSLSQAYQALPFNVTTQTIIDPAATIEPPAENGSGGTFENVTLLGGYAALTAPAAWDRQIHIFMRNGVEVDRYVDGTAGSSDNFADLVRYLLESSGEVQDGLIDHDSLELTSQFLSASGIRFSGVLAGTSGLGEYIDRTAPLFMCVGTRDQGKVGILPSLPLADDYTISTAFISPSLTYTMADIVQGTFNVQYVPATERKPFQAVMAWRDPLIPGKTTQTTVSYAGRAVSGPYEQYDLTGFCASEEQAIKVGRFILAQRLYVGHSISFQLLPSATAPAIGDLIRVVRDIMPNGAADRRESFVYRVTRLAFSVDGAVMATAVHHPRDDQGVSQIAQEILATASLEAQTPEDWSGLPPYDGAVPAAVAVGSGDYIAATGGAVFYQGDYKYHIFTNTLTIHSSIFPTLTAEPSDPYLSYIIDGATRYKLLVNSGVFAFTGTSNNILTAVSREYADITAASKIADTDPLIGSNDQTQGNWNRFRVFSSPAGGTMDVLAVGGGGMALSPGFAAYGPAGGGEVVSQTIAATPGYYVAWPGQNGWSYWGDWTGFKSYRGQTDSTYSDSYLSYDPFTYTGANVFPLASATNLLLHARGGSSSFSGTYPTFTVSGASGNGNARGTAIGSTVGGGGGAGGAGGNAISSSVGGDGGAGVISHIFGTPIEFGGGGGGGVGNTSVPSPTAGATLITPGSGGGGINGNAAPAGTVTSAGYCGRDGIVVIKYRYKG
jgi:hypothetical protein